MEQSRIRNNQLWRQAQIVANRIGGQRKNDFDYIMSIYRRLGGTVRAKGCGTIKKKKLERNPLDTIGLEGGMYNGSKRS